ncbi:MAG: serine/threonine protein kinase [Bryobacterales bacterium]|jgi:serine/threonine-protein kinase|nr:serine/threonine protein kinase [Bryobacterales bacterium]
MPFRPGEHLGDYEILRLLGAGGMGEVYQVRNVLSDRVEAIKVLSSGLQASPELQDRFLREIKISAALKHPHIAELRTAQRVDSLLIMVMEFVDGLTVDALLKGGPLPPKNALHYTGQVLDALGYAHARGVIHRDIKPQNIMVTAGDEVRLMDFGIARSLADQGMTMTGMTLGSLYYMSPEQIRGEHADHRADLYSLGITLYEMATGSRPFEGSSGYTVMAAHLDQPPLPPLERNPALPDALNDIILKAIAKRPEDRFQDATSFQQAILALQGGVEGRLDSSIFKTAYTERAQAVTLGAAAHPHLNSPTQTMPATPTPLADQPAAPPAKSKWENLVGLAGMAVGLIAILVIFGPRLFQTTPDKAPESQVSQGRFRGDGPPPPDAPLPPASGANQRADDNPRDRRGRPPSEGETEVRQAYSEVDQALRAAGIDIARSGPEAREGRRFMALERADALLAIAKRYQEAAEKRDALGLRRRDIPRYIQGMTQDQRQASLGPLGDHLRKVSDSLAAAEAAVKSQNLRLAHEELGEAEQALEAADKLMKQIESFGKSSPTPNPR